MGREIIGYEHAGAVHCFDADSVTQWRALTGVNPGAFGLRDLADLTPPPEMLYLTEHGYALITRQQLDGGGLAAILSPIDALRWLASHGHRPPAELISSAAAHAIEGQGAPAIPRRKRKAKGDVGGAAPT